MAVTSADVARMTDSLFIEGPWRSRSSTKFWTLLVLASIIAVAGVEADSTATVIGAMIVAPLMTPILGLALSLVLSDRSHVVRNALLIVAGALAVVLIGYVVGVVDHPYDAFASNSQVNARISPRLIDLLAALATGTVGAFALVRSDISDALPGVAIAISLVPPLAVVGLLLAVQRYASAAQAGLLFATNVAAIVATGTAVLLVYRVREAAEVAGYPVGVLRGRTMAVVVAGLLLVAVPLTIGSASVIRDQRLIAQAQPIAQSWARAAGWQVTTVEAVNGVIVVTALGPPPQVNPALLRTELNADGLSGSDLTIRLIVGGTRLCAAGTNTCTTVEGLA
jgi:uncharacterized hydrophobic protein (TIGR00271 family)